MGQDVEVSQQRSLFGYYVQAALIAAQMQIGLDYAFKRYVKPEMPSEGLLTFTHEEAEALVRSGHIR